MSASLLKRSIIAVTWITAACAASARAEDVSVNLDALGAPQSAPVEGATQATGSKEQPIEAPANQSKPAASEPKPAAAPKSGAKQTAAEIDFISRTKQNVAPSAANAKPVKAVKPAEPAAPAEVKVQEVEYIPEPIIVRGKSTGQPANIAPPPTASPAAPVASPSAPVAVEPIPVATTPSPPAAPKPPATPKKAKPPATVLIDQTALEGGEAAAKPGALQGTPLTKVKPVGTLFVPSDTNNLPSPEAVQGQAPPLPNIGEEPTPLAVPAIVEAPAPTPVPEQPVEQVAVQPEAPAPVPSTVTETPTTTQAVAEIAARSKKDAAAGAAARRDVLAGQAIAGVVQFAPASSDLTPEAIDALTTLAQSLRTQNLRVQLAGYSGPAGNTANDSRRLSLLRTLAVRNFLGTQGVPRAMVNVLAMAGALEGSAERVDVLVRTDQLPKLGLQAPQ